MKSFSLLLAFCLWLSATAAHAQWQTTTYTLKGGWNAIYLTGDAKQDTLDNLFPAQVLEVWRWNTNPTQVQFMASPSVPSAGTPEWSIWKRGFPTQSTFSELSGQTAYLVKCSGTTANTYTAAIKQSPLPPTANWVRNGANLMGFPVKLNGTYPTFSSYFATFPAAIAANTKVFKYIGGDMGAGNPVQLFSTTSERIDRTQAYWFSAEVVENFQTPLEISLSDNAGLDFGRSGSISTIRIRNRSAAAVTLTLATVNSESKPVGQTDIFAPVPLMRRVFNTTTLVWDEIPITAAGYTESIPALSTVELPFGINRGAMAGDSASLFASFLRLTDGGNLMDVVLPARAQKSSLTGLWVGDIQVSAVGSKVAGSPGETTPEPFKLRTLLHVATGGSARLLSQVFLGQLAVAPNEVGLCTLESLLKQDAKAQAQRLVAAHMPLDQVITGSGAVAVPGSLSCTINVPYNDPTNPFVHQYHPDHDNKDARFADIALPVSQSATATAAITAAVVTGVTVGASGSRYKTIPAVSVSPPPSGTTAVVSAIVTGGKVTGFTIVNPGSGYLAAPTVTIAPNPNPTPATATLSDGVEAPAITRTCTFTFTASPPAGSAVTSGWGSSVLGGTYSESISGIHKETITVSGIFELQRASEIGTLSQ